MPNRFFIRTGDFSIPALHYCIVLDKTNALSSGTLTVIPLTSIKENKKYNSSTLNLGNEIYFKLRKICDDMSQKLSKEYGLKGHLHVVWIIKK